MDIDELDDEAPDDRPRICPACGVTMGLVATDDGAVEEACLECGFGQGDDRV